MKKFFKKLMLLSMASILTFSSMASMPQMVKSVQALAPQAKMSRLSGNDRFHTARVIAEKVNNTKTQSVVLSTGLGYADALSASVLARKMNAPILLVNDTMNGSKEAFSYIAKYLDRNGTVYITGGPGVIDPDFETQLNRLGIKKIVRLGGQDRYETAYLIAQENLAPKNTPVVIASGDNFPDALSISSFAAYNGWPILLVPDQGLPDKIKEYLSINEPSKVYIAGGPGAVTVTVESEIIQQVPDATIKRFSGKDRFETAGKIVEEFAPTAETVYIATGNNFADALAGSVLAAQTGAPIVLVDSTISTLPSAISDYLTKLKQPNSYIFGGVGPVSETLEAQIKSILTGNSSGNSFEVIEID